MVTKYLCNITGFAINSD